MKVLKKAYNSLEKELLARHILFRLGDWRAFRPVLGKTLISAATVWPHVMPNRWKPQSILDIGAYKGDVSKELSCLYHPKFVGLVEPQQELAELLKTKNFAPIQKVFPCAVGRKNGTAILKITRNLASSSFLDITPQAEKSYGCQEGEMSIVKTQETLVRTLDSIFTECEIEEIDLLKMDIHGYEVDALQSGKEALKSTHVVISEVMFFEHFKGQPMFKDIYAELLSIGFELSAMYEWSYTKSGYPLHANAVFLNRKSIEKGIFVPLEMS